MSLSRNAIVAALVIFGATLGGVARLSAGSGCNTRSHCHRSSYQAPRQVVYRQAPQTQIRPIALPPAQQLTQPELTTPSQQLRQIEPAAGQQPTQLTQPSQPQAQPQQQPLTQRQPLQSAARLSQPSAQPSAQPSPTANSAQISALQALGGLAPEPAPAATTRNALDQKTPSQPTQATTQATTHIGAWSAQLPNGTRVLLSLLADGSFRWSVKTNTGKTSAFQGTYSVENGSLALIRSMDNQKLAGAMNRSNDNAFNFKLNGATDSGLNFTRV